MLNRYSPYTVSQASSLQITVVNNKRLLFIITFFFLPFIFALPVGEERELFEGRAVVTLVVNGDGEALSEKKKKKKE